jgi:outer membrane autotransporter protein
MGIGYAHDKSTIGGDGSGSTSNGNSVTGYASYQASPTMFVDGLLGYGDINMDTTRYVALANDFARASRTGKHTFLSVATGYEHRNDTLLLSPYARYDYASDRLNAVTENGAGIYALNYGSQTLTTQQISLGIRAESQHKIDVGMLLPRVRFEYQHHIEGADQSTVAYADSASTRYNLATPVTNTNSMLIGVGSGLAMRNGLNLDVNYHWQHAAGKENSRTIYLRLSMPFGG